MPDSRIRAMSLSIVREVTPSADARATPERGEPRYRRSSSMSACWRSMRRRVRCGSVDLENATTSTVPVQCLSASLCTVVHMTSTTLLLISGAGLPPWIWDDATTGLDATVARRPEDTNASLLQYAQAALDSASPGAITIVAHSAGGVVAAAMTTLAPARVRGILAVTAVIPTPGGSFIGAMPLPNRLILSAVMHVAGTRPPASALRSGLASGLDADLSQRLVNDFTRESQSYYRDRTPMFDMPHHRGYVTTTNDQEIPLALQEGFAARLAPDFEERIDGGHLPMLEHPEALRKCIAKFHASVQ